MIQWGEANVGVREGTEAGEAWKASELALLHGASLPPTLHIQLIVNPVGSSFRVFLESDPSFSPLLYTTAPANTISYLDQCNGFLIGLPVSTPVSHFWTFAFAVSSAWSSSPRCPLCSFFTFFRSLFKCYFASEAFPQPPFLEENGHTHTHSHPVLPVNFSR